MKKIIIFNELMDLKMDTLLLIEKNKPESGILPLTGLGIVKK